MLAEKQSLEAQVGCKSLPGVQAGTDCRPSSGCTALSDSESARLCSGAARQLFTGILVHDLFCRCCKLELTIVPAASTGCRQVGLHPKINSAWASWAAWAGLIIKFQAHWPKQMFGILSRSCAVWLVKLKHYDRRSCELLVLLLFSLFNYNKI